jgi:hypothetical protein
MHAALDRWSVDVPTTAAGQCPPMPADAHSAHPRSLDGMDGMDGTSGLGGLGDMVGMSAGIGLNPAKPL